MPLVKIIKKRKPVVIAWDIETTHNIIAAFDLYNPNPVSNILQEKYMILHFFVLEKGQGLE